MEQLHGSMSIKVGTACGSYILCYGALASVSVPKWNRLVLKQKADFNPVL